METGEVGEYKVAYPIEGDPKRMASDMFDTYGEVLEFLEAKQPSDYFLFRRDGLNNGNHYEWVLEDKGSYRLYRVIWFIKRNWLAILAIIAAIVTYIVYKRYANKKVAMGGGSSPVRIIDTPMPAPAPAPVPAPVPAPPVPPLPA